MGTSAKLRAFSPPPRQLPREASAFWNKVRDAHKELKILGSGPVTPGIRRMAEMLRSGLEKDYAALAPLKNRLEEESGIFFSYDSALYDLVVADILEKSEISGCPVAMVCNPEILSLYRGNKLPYRAHYQATPPAGMRSGIIVYPGLYLSDAEAAKRTSIDPGRLYEAYSLANDATDLVRLMPGNLPPKAKLALAISDMMSSSEFGGTVESHADRKIHEAVVHELAHFFHARASGGSFGSGEESEEDARFILLSSEMLASSAELAYGTDPRAALGSFLAGQLLPKPRPEASQVIRYFNSVLLGEDAEDIQGMLPAYLGVAAGEIREIAMEMLDSICETLFGKPWREVADERGFEDAKRLVFGS